MGLPKIINFNALSNIEMNDPFILRLVLKKKSKNQIEGWFYMGDLSLHKPSGIHIQTSCYSIKGWCYTDLLCCIQMRGAQGVKFHHHHPHRKPFTKYSIQNKLEIVEVGVFPPIFKIRLNRGIIFNLCIIPAGLPCT